MGQPALGQQHAGLGGLAVMDRHGGAVGADVEGDVGVVESGADGGDIAAVEAGIERLGGGTAEVIAADPDQREDRDPDRRQRAELAASELEQIRPQPLHLVHRVHRIP